MWYGQWVEEQLELHEDLEEWEEFKWGAGRHIQGLFVLQETSQG